MSIDGLHVFHQSALQANNGQIVAVVELFGGVGELHTSLLSFMASKPESTLTFAVGLILVKLETGS